jgi:hypothetical protein
MDDKERVMHPKYTLNIGGHFTCEGISETVSCHEQFDRARRTQGV